MVSGLFEFHSSSEIAGIIAKELDHGLPDAVTLALNGDLRQGQTVLATGITPAILRELEYIQNPAAIHEWSRPARS